jgi:Mrp family chromosome partitioning ATPase
MSIQRPISNRILELLQDSKDCEFDSLVARAPELTSSEIYQEISRLSREGRVIITRDVGIFAIRQATVSH